MAIVAMKKESSFSLCSLYQESYAAFVMPEFRFSSMIDHRASLKGLPD